MAGDYARWLENEIAMVLTFDRPQDSRPTSLRTAMAAAGITAESPADLGVEGERLAKLERQDR